MKPILAVVLSGLLAVLPASCSRVETARMEMATQETRDVQWPAGREVHEYGPGGSVADMDLTQFDFDTRAKIESLR